MSFRRDEALQLQEEDPQTGASRLSDRNGTRREETLSGLPPASALHYNTVENDEDDQDYSPDQVYRYYVAVEDVHRGRRRRREQLSDEEDNIEDAPPSRRQRMEREVDEYKVFELTNLERSSPPILEFIPVEDATSSSEHFWGRRRRREQMTDEEDSNEEAPPSSRQRMKQEDEECEVFELTDLERSSFPSWSLIPTVEDSPSSSEHFWWMRRREQMTDEEDNDKEAPPRRSQDVEQEEDEYEMFEITNLEWTSLFLCTLSPSLEFIPIVDAPSSNEHFWWMRRRQYVDSDEETPMYENMPHQNGVVGVIYVLLVFVRISIINLDPAGIISISVLSISIILLAITN